MVKWSRLKLALLAVGSALPALALGGCLGENWYGRLVQYVVIANLFD